VQQMDVGRKKVRAFNTKDLEDEHEGAEPPEDDEPSWIFRVADDGSGGGLQDRPEGWSIVHDGEHDEAERSTARSCSEISTYLNSDRLKTAPRLLIIRISRH
jgi:hypothetical protein